MATLDEARAAKPRIAEVFSRVAEVVGIGITRDADGFAVKVNLAGPATAELPQEVEGIPVRVEIVGNIRKRLVKKRATAPAKAKAVAKKNARAGAKKTKTRRKTP